MATFDVSDTWLRASYFFVTHRQDLKKWWVLLLTAVDVFLIVFVLTNLLIYVVTLARGDRLMTSLVSLASGYGEVREASVPASLNVQSAQAIPRTEGTFDLIAKVKNPNRTWAVRRVVPSFSFRGETAQGDPDFFLPGDEKFLLFFGLKVPARREAVSATETVSVSFGEPSWQRVPDAKKLPAHDFLVTHLKHRVVAAGERTPINVSEVSGSVENRTVENFWQVRLKIVAFAGSTPVGINQVFLDRFEGLAIRSFAAQWPTALTSVSNVEVIPEVNVLESGMTYVK